MAHGLVELAQELALWTTINCQPFEPTFIAHLLSAVRYSGMLVSLALYVASIRYCEVYLFLFGVGSTINWAINILLRIIANDITRASPLCLDVYEINDSNWPSFQSQTAAFIVTFLCTYVVLYKPRMHILAAVFLQMFYCAVIAGDLLLNYHTRSQIVGGVFAGSIIATLLQLVIRFAVVPFMPRILSWRIARYFEYRDTLCMPTPIGKDE